jgi:pimeloyl-ACP methyl ester carboxylesterase
MKYFAWVVSVLLGLYAFGQESDYPRSVSFLTEDGGMIVADSYGSSTRGIVLAHGGPYRKESWEPQARQFERAGFAVLAFDFRGFGASRGPRQDDLESAPLHFDVLAGVRHMKASGARTVSVVGASMGGSAAVDAAILSKPGEIDRVLVLGAGAGNLDPRRFSHPKLFIVSREDRSGSGLRLPEIQSAFEKMPQPKRLLIVDGSGHAQALFQSNQGARVMSEILEFLSAR